MLQIYKTRFALVLVIALVLAVAIGCSSGATTPTSAPANPPATVAIATVAPTNAPATSAATATTSSATATTEAPATTPTTAADDPNETVVLVVVSEKSEARYRVREQLAGVSLPSDAIGKTKAVTGQIVGKRDGTIVSAESKFVVDVRTLKSDQGMRDNFIQRTPLATSQFPNVTFVPTSAPGLPLIVPDSRQSSFQLIGDLTIKDVTKPVTWEASCTLEANETDGLCTATTTFTFADFSLEQPRVGRVVSIEDHITLEVDLFLQRVQP
jgi:polyisoprenoid-binding protein YceI